jgi:hypothetical protein
MTDLSCYAEGCGVKAESASSMQTHIRNAHHNKAPIEITYFAFPDLPNDTGKRPKPKSSQTILQNGADGRKSDVDNASWEDEEEEEEEEGDDKEVERNQVELNSGEIISGRNLSFR